jgi:SAM-dependent methyltransferase
MLPQFRESYRRLLVSCLAFGLVATLLGMLLELSFVSTPGVRERGFPVVSLKRSGSPPKWRVHPAGFAIDMLLWFMPTYFVGDLILAFRERRAWKRLRGRSCLTCGYDLRGQTVRRCPECGSPFGGSLPANPDLQTAYWDRVAAQKTFSHPIDFELLGRYVRPGSHILDIGCGYGRLCAELATQGYTNVIGIDSSVGMIARGKAEHPRLDLRVAQSAELPFEDGSFDAVLLFAVLTCIPEDEKLRRLVAEITRVLQPGGILYLSDYCLQPDARNLERYAQNEPTFGTYGVFALPEGVVVRHFEFAWLENLLAGFEVPARRTVEISTMNAHSAVATQMLLRRRS